MKPQKAIIVNDAINPDPPWVVVSAPGVGTVVVVVDVVGTVGAVAVEVDAVEVDAVEVDVGTVGVSVGSSPLNQASIPGKLLFNQTLLLVTALIAKATSSDVICPRLRIAWNFKKCSIRLMRLFIGKTILLKFPGIACKIAA